MLLPTKARFAPGESPAVELTPARAPRWLRVEHLGDEVARVEVAAGAKWRELPALPEGGYAVSLLSTAGEVLGQTAVEILADPVARMRYGFVASFSPGRDISGVLHNFRRLHLTGAQFYDWGYRHADLVAPQEDWVDPLGQPVSIRTVRTPAEGFRAAGTLPIGYAAVYGVGKAEWPDWQHAALLRPDGTPYDLAGFLSIVDPSDNAWLAHFCADLVRAAEAGGFAGFHLDQYGFPRRAVRSDGRVVDVAAAFDTLIRRVRECLPYACLVFNNVNDFPVWRTTGSPQDVTYTEVWEPHDTLADLAAVATRSRTLAPDRPAVLAAYQTIYATQPAAVADTATKLTMATLFSHGATQLLAGEAGNILVDPYYVRNHRAEQSTLDMLTRWYDLLVAAGDVLLGLGQADVTRSVVGTLNAEIEVLAGGDRLRSGDVTVSHEASPGVVWRRVVETQHGLVVHLINLTDQEESGWDTPKALVRPVTGLRLRLRRTESTPPVVLVADPDRGPSFTALAVAADSNSDGHLQADLPALGVWQIVLIRY